MLSLLFPNERNICPKSTNEHEVKRFKSSAFAIFNVSLKYLLQNKIENDAQLCRNKIRTLLHCIFLEKMLGALEHNKQLLLNCVSGMVKIQD
jgi:hypothetical protein